MYGEQSFDPFDSTQGLRLTQDFQPFGKLRTSCQRSKETKKEHESATTRHSEDHKADFDW